MNILDIQYTLNNKALEIYVAGCNARPHCKGCHNPESWQFDIGRKYDRSCYEKIHHKIHFFDSLIDSIMILGGEPLDQLESELTKLIVDVSQFNKQIWLFTRYELEDVPQSILNFCDYVKCGTYDVQKQCENNIQFGIKLASSNQNIYRRGIDYCRKD